MSERGARKGAPNPPMADQLIKVLRPFFLQGNAQKKGAEIKVDAKLAAELRSLGKAEYLSEPTKPAPRAATKES